MTPNDAAAVLEHIVEKRGAEWIVTNWGLDREQLARWYEGQEELPPEMVLAMRVWVSAVNRPKGEAGCFEDRDHPPKPTIKWHDAVAWAYDGGQITIRMAEDQEDARRMSLVDLMAGKAKISVELDERGEWKGKWKPVDADEHPPEVPEDVTETGWLCTDADGRPWGEIRIPANSRGELLWEAYRLEVGPLNDSELLEMIKPAWEEAGRQCGVDDVLRQWEWLPNIMPHDAWNKDANWDSLIRTLADVVRCAIEGDDR